MITNNTEDLFICGKCHINFNDLNLFLTHRSTCNIPQLTNLYPLTNTTSTDLLERELNAIIEDVSLNVPPPPRRTTTAENLLCDNVSTTNEFDLLFSEPVEQHSVLNEPNTYNPVEDLSIEHGISQISILECPVCDEQFEAPTILENHVFEHSTWIDENDNLNSTNVLNMDESSSSYIDLFDEQPTTPIECEQCTITFQSNASLKMHKKMGKEKNVFLFIFSSEIWFFL